MIVKEPPYDLVALFSDLEMQKLLEALIERGQEQGRECARPFRWRSLRDPRRDTVWNEPERALGPFLRMDCCFLILWDHSGSGLESQRAVEVEPLVVNRLAHSGIPSEKVLAVAFDPELECLFAPVWPKVKRVIALERELPPPEDSAILEEAQRQFPRLRWSGAFEEALEQHPKELFETLVRQIRLRRAAPLYEKLGTQMSLRALKRNPMALRIASTIASWFPATE